MKQIVGYLVLFFESYPHLGFWFGWVAFLGLAIGLRYAEVYDPSFAGYSFPFLGKLLFYTVPYFFSVFWWYLWYGRGSSIFFELHFWVLSSLILGVLFINKYGLFYKSFVPSLPERGSLWFLGLGFNLHSAFFFLLAPLLYGLYTQQLSSTRFYGCTALNFHFSPYFVMLLCMLPLLVWASFQPSFLESYPRYRPGAWEYFAGVSSHFTISTYELSYVIQFLALEIFFRGFIVLALGEYMGKAAVIPMVSVYAFLHFYKPLPETIGSIFGGFILGTVAWHSLSVLGGMIVHVGIALMMELLAFWQIYGVKQQV